MTDHFKIDINGSILLLFILGILIILFIVWMYRSTIPPSGRRKRIVLTVIRSLVLSLILFFIFEPVLIRYYQEKELPVIPVLIDQSGSMSVRDSSGSRGENVIRFLNDPVWKDLSEHHDIRYFIFSDSLKDKTISNDSIRFNGWSTDISASLEAVTRRMSGKNLAAVVLVTDGQYNLGSNPASFAEFAEVPVHTVGFGDSTEMKDISIEQVLTNSVAFVNAKVPMDVTIASSGFRGKSLTVQVRKNQKLVETKTATAPDDLSRTQVHFDITADEEGMHRYEIAIVPLSGEHTSVNNSKSVYIQVLKSRVKVMLISGQPGPDQTMIYQSVISNPDYALMAMIQKPDGSFISMSDDQTLPASLTDYDCYIFNQYPTARSNAAYLTQLTDHIREKRKPWLFVYGPAADMAKYKSFKDAGGIDFAADPNIKETQVSLKLTAQGKNNSIIQINESLEATDRYWSDLPPVWIQKFIPVPAVNSTVLARADMSKAPQVLKLHGDIPLIISTKHNKQKTITVSFYGFWKLHFTPLGLGKTNPVFAGFLEQSIRWLTLTDDSKPVTVQTTKTVYQSGERIVISGQVYDEQFRPVNDAVFNITIRSKEVQTALRLNSAGNGRYESSAGALPVGDYTITGDAEWNGVSLGRDSRKFSVEAYSVELTRTAQNTNLLRRISRLSGGQYLTPDRPGDLRQAIHYEAAVIDKKDETDLWNKSWMLFLIAALLALEWWIRKRSDML